MCCSLFFQVAFPILICVTQAKLHELMAAKRKDATNQEAVSKFNTSVQRAAESRREEDTQKVRLPLLLICTLHANFYLCHKTLYF